MSEYEPGVHVLVPSLGGLSPGLEDWVIAHLQNGAQMRFEKLLQPNSGFVEDARQQQADAFLGGPYEWALFLDADTVPHITAPAMLAGAIKHGFPAVVGAVPHHSQTEGGGPGIFVNFCVETPDGKARAVRWHDVPWGGPRYLPGVLRAGLACALLRRDVIELLMNRAEQGIDDYPFRAEYVRGRVTMHEDWMFWSRVLSAGFKIVADLRAVCNHDKRWTLTPMHAITDLPFHEPGAKANPDAPKEGLAPRFWHEKPSEDDRPGPRIAKPKLTVVR